MGFKRDQIVIHKLTGHRVMVLRRALLPIGGYMVRLPDYRRRRMHAGELRPLTDSEQRQRQL
jgi:hypothetical protein